MSSSSAAAAAAQAATAMNWPKSRFGRPKDGENARVNFTLRWATTMVELLGFESQDPREGSRRAHLVVVVATAVQLSWIGAADKPIRSRLSAESGPSSSHTSEPSLSLSARAALLFA